MPLAFVIKGVCVLLHVTSLLSRGRSNVLCITFLIDYPLENGLKKMTSKFFSYSFIFSILSFFQKKFKVIICCLQRGQVEQIFFSGRYNTPFLFRGRKKMSLTLIFHSPSSCPSDGHVAVKILEKKNKAKNELHICPGE